MSIQKHFVYFKNKSRFLEEKEAGNILNTSIVFIEDTLEIYTHGTYFDGKDTANIEEILKNKLDKTEAANMYQPKGNYLTQHQSLDYINVMDLREEKRGPEYYAPWKLSAWFNIKGSPNGNWCSGINVKGWTNNYSSWELAADASDDAVDSNLYFRTGRDVTWEPWQKVLTSGNSRINSGVITINGVSITPLTSHLSLADYVTLNTAQTISGAKTFGADVTIADGKKITFAKDAAVSFDQFGNLYRNSTGSTWDIFKEDKTTRLSSLSLTTGVLTTNGFVKRGGTASQFLKADGSVDGNSYALASALSNYYTKTEAASLYQPKGDYVKTNSDATLAQLTLASSYDRKLVLDNTDNETYWLLISFRDHGTEYGYLGTRGSTDLEWNTYKILHTGNYSTILDERYSNTLTLQLNGTEIGTFNPTANKTINIGDVASAAALASHVGNATAHISSTERTAWNKTTEDLATIMGANSDTVINKWEEIVAFLDTYTEADTLAGLLSNKADKTTSINAGTGLTGGGTLAESRTLSLAASGVTAGTYFKTTVDTYGRVTSGSNPTTLSGYGITDAYTKSESNGLLAPVVAYNYADGCLVRLKTPANVATMVTVLIEGNSYWAKMPIKTIVQFYNYPPSDEIINTGAIHFGQDFGTIKVFNYDGHVYLWFIENLGFYTFAVTAITEAVGKSIGNAVESITNAPMPTEGVTRLVTITPSKGLRSDNYASILNNVYVTKTEFDKKQGSIVSLTQALYDALSTKDSLTLYIVD